MPSILYLFGSPNVFLVAEDPEIVEERIKECIEEQNPYVKLNAFTVEKLAVAKEKPVPPSLSEQNELSVETSVIAKMFKEYAPEQNDQQLPEEEIEMEVQYRDSYAEMRIRVDQIAVIREPHANEIPTV